MRRNLVIIGSVFVFLFHSIMSKSSSSFLVALLGTLAIIFLIKVVLHFVRSSKEVAEKPRHLKRIIEELKLANRGKSFIEAQGSAEPIVERESFNQLEIELEVEPRKKAPLPELPDFDQLFKHRNP